MSADTAQMVQTKRRWWAARLGLSSSKWLAVFGFQSVLIDWDTWMVVIDPITEEISFVLKSLTYPLSLIPRVNTAIYNLIALISRGIAILATILIIPSLFLLMEGAAILLAALTVVVSAPPISLAVLVDVAYGALRGVYNWLNSLDFSKPTAIPRLNEERLELNAETDLPEFFKAIDNAPLNKTVLIEFECSAELEVPEHFSLERVSADEQESEFYQFDLCKELTENCTEGTYYAVLSQVNYSTTFEILKPSQLTQKKQSVDTSTANTVLPYLGPHTGMPMSFKAHPVTQSGKTAGEKVLQVQDITGLKSTFRLLDRRQTTAQASEQQSSHVESSKQNRLT